MLKTCRWDKNPSENMGALVIGSIESQRYAQGLTIIKTLFNYLDSVFTTQTKYLRSNALTLDMLKNSLQKGLNQTEWENWVIDLANKKNLFLKIVGKTQDDFNDILIDIANATQMDGLTTRAIVATHFLNADYFKQTVAEKAYAAALGVKQVAVATKEGLTGTFNFIDNTKYFLLAGGLGFLLYKLLGQSDKVSKAYSTIKSDAGKLYSKAKEKGSKTISSYKKSKAKANPRRRKITRR